MNTSSKKYENDLMDLFADSSDDDQEKIKQYQKDLNQSIDDENLFSIIREKLDSKKRIDSKQSECIMNVFQIIEVNGTEIKFNPPFKILPLSINEKHMEIDFGASRIQSIRKAPHSNRVEFIIEEESSAEKYTSQTQGRLKELIERVQNMGLINREQVQASIDKINQIKKLVSKIIENYFSNLINELDQINKNTSLQQLQDQLLKDIYRLLQKVNSEVEYDREKFKQYDETLEKLINTIKQKEQEFPKYVHADVKIDKITQLQNILPSLIHLELKEQVFKYIPLSIKSVINSTKSFQIQLKSKQKIKSGSDIFAYIPEKNSIIHYHVSEQTQKYEQIFPDTIVKPVQCTLIYHEESKHLFLVCQSVLLNQQEEPIEQIQKFSLESKQLSKCSPMPSKRQLAQVIRKKDFIYVWGGVVYCQNQKLFAKSGFKYDIKQDEWKKIEAMKNPRVKGQCCLLGDKIYLFGGMQNKLQLNPNTELFEKKYIILNSMAYIPSLLAFVVPVSYREIVLFGGNMNKENSYNYLLDTSQKTIQKSEFVVGLNKCQNTTDPIIYNQKILVAQITTDSYLKSKNLEIMEIGEKGVNTFKRIQS